MAKKWLPVTASQPGVLDVPVEVAEALQGPFIAGLERQMRGRTVPVERATGGIYHPDPVTNDGAYPRDPQPFDEAVAMVMDEQGAGAAGAYISSLPVDLVALQSDNLTRLGLDLRVMTGRRLEKFHAAWAFYGGPQSGSSLHFDITENVVLMLQGEKVVRLHAARSTNRVRRYGIRTRLPNYAAGSPTLQAAGVPESEVRECTIAAGQALIIPPGWWHEVVNMTPAISITLLWRPQWWAHLVCPNCRHVLLSSLITGPYLKQEQRKQ